MKNDYKTRYKNMFDEIKSPQILNHVRMDEFPTSFSRKRKMPVDDIIISILSRKGLTAEMDILDYFTEKGNGESISKQAYLKQRKKLNYEVFSYLNKSYLKNFYQEITEADLFKGYLVLAVDGSKAEVPASEENIKLFGEKDREKGVVRALVSCITDVFNKFTLDMQLGSIYDRESDLAVISISNVKEIIGEIPTVIIMDRGYPGIELMNILDGMGIKYLFRLSSNDYKKERGDMYQNDENVRIKHTYARIAKIRKKRPETAELLKSKEYTETRIIKTTTPSEKEITFATNLSSSEISSEEISTLYFKRWKIEESYNALKNKLKFESVTGEATIYVYQDFWSQVLVYNMVQDVLNSANQELDDNEDVNRYKYRIHANENMAIGLFKRVMIKMMLEEDLIRRTEMMSKLQKSIEKYILPYRKCKSHERVFRSSNKNKRNMKRTF